jgi:PAP2 superfamily
LIATPPFPDHPSGHGCFSGSVVRTLQEFFDTNRMTFSTNSAISGTTRTFTRFSQTRDEVIDARVYSGIHFRTADVHGFVLGRRTANFVQNHFFEPED